MAAYVGEVMTTNAADELKGLDSYLFDLNHFVQRGPGVIKSDKSLTAKQRREEIAAMPPVPELVNTDFSSLTVDARRQGNAVRFVNHSCEPNCIIQPVFAKEARSALYFYVGIFTGQAPVAAAQELTLDYGYTADLVTGQKIKCRCGANSCRTWLL